MIDYTLLQQIDSPADLRKLDKTQLSLVCEQLRQYLLESVSQSSGHLASGLGVVELTVALHYVFDTPFDQLIWDVGHQAYPHKILTGRREQLKTIRQKDGLHPFPWREESEYDVLGVGHSSTSISAGLGVALAAQHEGKNRKTICVIGDGAITAGMAFEALNHAGSLHSDMLVILNDNEMSISENVGGLNKHFARFMTAPFYTNLRESGKKVLSNVPPIKEFVKKTEEHIKGFVSPVGTMFEQLGFNYIGPIDGHNVEELITTLSNMKKRTGPQFLHIKTKKGKGYAPAEKDPISYHGVPKFDHKCGELPKSQAASPTYSKIFGDWLCEMAEQDPKLVGITPAMREGSGMVEFSQKFPAQFFDAAIAEQHAVTLAAGFAIGGMHPVVAIYSTFLQRAYDQVIHDVAIQKLPVLFAIDRAGIVGADGPTHQGAFDISFLRCIPNLVIMTPSDENECRQMLYTGYKCGQPAAVRYPRGNAVGVELKPLAELPLGKATERRKGSKIAILNFGTLLPQVQIAADKLDATVIDMRFVKPLDTAKLDELVRDHDVLVTVEENAIRGGAGSAVGEYLFEKQYMVKLLNIGLPDFFVPQGSQCEMLAEMKLDAKGIEEQIHQFIEK